MFDWPGSWSMISAGVLGLVSGALVMLFLMRRDLWGRVWKVLKKAVWGA